MKHTFNYLLLLQHEYDAIDVGRFRREAFEIRLFGEQDRDFNSASDIDYEGRVGVEQRH
jgi:uncharacterized protein YozE (UPF0346 family)